MMTTSSMHRSRRLRMRRSWNISSRTRKRPQKTNSVSMGPIIAYYLARQNEIKTVRIILTAKANDFPEETTRMRVRDMYG